MHVCVCAWCLFFLIAWVALTLVNEMCVPHIAIELGVDNTRLLLCDVFCFASIIAQWSVTTVIICSALLLLRGA